MSSRVQPTTVAYIPKGAAEAVFYDRAKELLLDGPAGTGKSRACCEKLNLVAMKYPNCRILIARKTRASMTESVLVTFEQRVLPDDSPMKQGVSRKMRQVYRYPNGAEIIVAGLDNMMKIMSTEYDIIYVAEATEATENDWEMLTTRLRNNVLPYQQIIGDCNPDAPTHWLNARCNRGVTTRLSSKHKDNPTVTSSYLETLKNLTGVRRARLYEGKWAAAEGQIYEFDPEIHLIPRFEIPASWRRIRAIDFGFVHPFCCLWIAFDHDLRAYVYRQLYMSHRIVQDHAKQILDVSRGEFIEQTVADHDAEDRETLHQAGISTIPAFKLVSPGIQNVEERLRVQADGKPRLFVLRDSLIEPDTLLMEQKRTWNLEQEFDSYVWLKAGDGRPLKDVPLKENDHALDPLRYGCAFIDNLGGEQTILPVAGGHRTAFTPAYTRSYR